jgi:hypothetical protein
MKNNPQQLLIETQFEGLTICVRPDETHEWLRETKLVAEGYGVSEAVIRNHKSRNADEFEEHKHFTSVTNCYAGGLKRVNTFWTKRGVIRLGFFIKSARAKLFRDWAEDLIIRELKQKDKYVTVEMLQKNNRQQDAKMHQYLQGVYELLKKDSKEIRELIHNLSNRVDKIEQYLFQPHQLAERKAYVYLIRKIDTNEYKIGKSIAPNTRLKVFKQGGTKAEVILTIEFPNDDIALLWEAMLQNVFKHLHISGEWFSLSPKEVELIRNLSQSLEQFY